MHTKLGRLLQLERERLGLDLADIAEELKISMTNLEAIEAGDSSALPGEMYFGLFAKSYAERLGIDYTRTVDAIKEDIGVTKEEPHKKPSGGAGKKEAPKKAGQESEGDEDVSSDSSLFGRGLIKLIGLVVILFGVFVAVYLIWFNTEGPARQADEMSNDAAETSTHQEAQPQDDWSHYDWNVKEVEAPPPLVLTLVAREESWATIVADGDTTIYRTLTPWREFTVEAKYRLRISIGIPSRVTVKLNGQELDLRDPQTKRISRVEINQANLADFLTPKSSPAEEEPTTTTGQESVDQDSTAAVDTI